MNYKPCNLGCFFNIKSEKSISPAAAAKGCVVNRGVTFNKQALGVLPANTNKCAVTQSPFLIPVIGARRVTTGVFELKRSKPPTGKAGPALYERQMTTLSGGLVTFCLREYSRLSENEHFSLYRCPNPWLPLSPNMFRTHKELNKYLVICILKPQKLLQPQGHHWRHVQRQGQIAFSYSLLQLDVAGASRMAPEVGTSSEHNYSSLRNSFG